MRLLTSPLVVCAFNASTSYEVLFFFNVKILNKFNSNYENLMLTITIKLTVSKISTKSIFNIFKNKSYNFNPREKLNPVDLPRIFFTVTQ